MSRSTGALNGTGVPPLDPGLPDGLPNTGVVAPEAIRLIGEDRIATQQGASEFHAKNSRRCAAVFRPLPAIAPRDAVSKNPGRAGVLLLESGAGYSAGDGFLRNSAARLSHNSILAPWRFMITPCCRIESRLFQAQ